MTELDPKDEAAFQDWYAKVAQQMKLNPNPDDPNHFYDYRGFYKSGASTAIDQKSGELHFPSTYKHDDHPNRFVLHEGQILDSKYERTYPVQALDRLWMYGANPFQVLKLGAELPMTYL